MTGCEIACSRRGGHGWTWVVGVAVEARQGTEAAPVDLTHFLLMYLGRKELLPLLLTTALEDDRRYW